MYISEDKKLWLSQFYTADELSLLTENEINELFSYSQPQKVTISQLKEVDTSEYRVKSLDGFVPVHEWRNKGIKPCRVITTDSNKSITSSFDHLFEMQGDLWKYADYILPGELIVTETGLETVTSNVITDPREVYDFYIDHPNHRYLTNGISSHNSGSGKSLFMQNLAVNWLQAGLSGAYITLELSEGLCSMRIDSMMTDTSTREIFKDLDNVEMKVRIAAKKAGKFRVKYMPAQSTVNDIRAYCKELQIQTGIKIDFLCVDYLDLLMPVSAKVSPSDLFVKDKYVSEELRNLAKELNVLFVTASQLNRSAVEEIEFDHSHISGGISKINTADNVFGIFTSRSMRERGQYQIQLMKTRSSSGVGQKIELAFDVETLRITDPDPEGYNSAPKPTPSDIMSKIKATSQIDSSSIAIEPLEKTVHADIQSVKLKSLLNSLKKP